MKILYWWRNLVWFWFYDGSTEHFQCDLCQRATHWENSSNYYDDVSACNICVPEGYRDSDIEVKDEVDKKYPLSNEPF